MRGATFVLWALAAGSVAYWGLRLGSSSRVPDVPVPPPRQAVAGDPIAIARMLGSSPTAAASPVAGAPSLASRLQLVGVAAGASSGGGAAVISVDGRPARPYRVGMAIEEGLVLQSVHGRSAVIARVADGQPVLTLELPPVKE